MTGKREAVLFFLPLGGGEQCKGFKWLYSSVSNKQRVQCEVTAFSGHESSMFGIVSSICSEVAGGGNFAVLIGRPTPSEDTAF